MRDVFGSKNWVFWWAALTATVFLRDQLPLLAGFFQDTGFFAPNVFPFSLVSGLNAWLDQLSQGIEAAVQFNPNAPLISSPIFVPNWILGLFVGLMVLVGGVALYLRALKTTGIGDDILTLFGLYFILRIEGYIIGFTKLGALQGAGNILTQNSMVGFWILMLALLVLVFIGGGINSRRAFWQGFLEAFLIALFLQPTQTALALRQFLLGLAYFSNLLMSNPVFGVMWGLAGSYLALRRLTTTQTAESHPAGSHH